MIHVEPIKLNEIHEDALAPLAMAELKAGGVEHRKSSLAWVARDEDGPQFYAGITPASLLALPELWFLMCKEFRLRPSLRRLSSDFCATHGPVIAFIQSRHVRFVKWLGFSVVSDYDGDWFKVRLG